MLYPSVIKSPLPIKIVIDITTTIAQNHIVF